MKNIAISKAMETSAHSKGSKSTHTANLVLKEGCVALYEVDSSASIFVSTDVRLSPVLGYLDTALYDYDNIPCGIRWWINEMNKQLDSSSPKSSFAKEHNVEYTIVSPMVKTYWGQSEPYDFFSSMASPHAPTGCCATALAQVLNYNRYPSSVSFVGHYYNAYDEVVHVEQINSSYDYPSLKEGYGSYMVNGVLKKQTYSMADKRKIATLMRDCGYSMYMTYTSEWSGAMMYDAAIGAVSCFGYPSNAVKYVNRAYYSDKEWYQMIYRELESGSPVIYGGNDPEHGGHAFVIHGVDKDGLLKVNWGWSGIDDGYYRMDAMNPGDYSFSKSQDAIIGVRSVPLPDDRYRSLWATDASFQINQENHLVFSGSFFNFDINPFLGNINIIIEDAESAEKQQIELFSYQDEDEPIDFMYGFTVDKETDLDDFIKMERGHKYHVYLYSRSKDEVEKQYVRSQGGCKYWIVGVDNDGVCTSESEMLDFPPTSFVRGDANDDGTVTVTDIVATANHILGATPDVFNSKAADSNQDNEITVTDIVYDAQYILNGEFPEVTDPEDK